MISEQMELLSKSSRKWFVIVFLIYFIGGSIAIYLAKGTLRQQDWLFSSSVSLIVSASSSMLGPKCEQMWRGGMKQRKQRKKNRKQET
ncbi:MAG: hypothetical protein OXH57_02515 [Ekhidna sp.]|nr:hypothetical protein [Ekhidna sp.]